jgi:hypothetical protein
MEDKFLEMYKKSVYEKLREVDRTIIPPTWWDSVIKHYYESGFSEEQTLRVILETMHK